MRVVNRFLVLVLLLLVGCRGQEDACAKAAQRFEQHLDEMRALKEKEPAGLEEKAIARKAFAALAKSCTVDEWPKDVVACVGNASSSAEFDKCEERLSELQQEKLTKAMAVAVGMPQGSSLSKADIAARIILKLTSEAFPLWSQANPDKACPAGLEAFLEYMSAKDTKDPWGNPYRMFCGPNLPPGAQGIAVISDGADGKPDTADDIKSW